MSTYTITFAACMLWGGFVGHRMREHGRVSLYGTVILGCIVISALLEKILS